MEKEVIEKVLEGIFNAFKQEEVELYKALMDKIPSVKKIEAVEDFYYEVVFPFERFLSGFIRTEISDNGDVEFILKNSRFITFHFEALIRDFEGHACCADKSRTIMKGLLGFYKEGKQIVFDYEQKYTFHLPKVIFKTHESILGFYEGLKMLYCGNPEKYLTELQKIAAQNTPKEEDLEENKHVVAVE